MLDPTTEYVPPGQEFKFREVLGGQVNVEHAVIHAQVRKNIRRPIPQINVFPPNEYKVALLCGGPSLADAKIPRGYKVATVNNTYNWALDRGLKPSIYIQLDARESNLRFVAKPLKTCRYLLHSQVHPAIFDHLKDYNVNIWHGVKKDSPESKILDRYYLKRWHNIRGGSSAGTRSIFLLYMLGVRTLRIYGMDSSLRKGEHHAYEQKENQHDSDAPITVKVGRRKFKAALWMASQLDEFLMMAPFIPPDMNVSFEGDGLLQYVVQETAKRGDVPRITMEK